MCALLTISVACTSAQAEDPLDEAIASFEAGALGTARARIEQILGSDENHHEARYYLGRVLLQVEDADAAIDQLKLAVELDPTRSAYRTWLGRAYITKLQSASFFEKGALAGRALDQLKRAVKLDPSNVEARISLAGYYTNAPSIAGGSKKKAREQLSVIQRHDPVRANEMWATIHIKNEEYDLAFHKLGACAQAEPENVDHIVRIALLHQKLQQFDDAFAALEQALSVDPESVAALYRIGRTAAVSGQNVDRGIECLQSYLRLPVPSGYPDYGAAHWRLGMLYEHRGEPDQAKREFEMAIQLDPEENRYREALKELGAR